jgi:hypothetical protein
LFLGKNGEVLVEGGEEGSGIHSDPYRQFSPHFLTQTSLNGFRFAQK